ncbi:ABC transporter permease [Paenibacillus donghaensis]|uniref:ABC transporter permease n=1 Tax=Paenibacillus donghaensis TaxID=414771 RepID=UPI001883E183|nr:ABC-2 family transporter protein [Paenibacillus donghaensis]MBE9914286.1 ABC transporter permease [Paenibacillus donghaensis]
MRRARSLYIYYRLISQQIKAIVSYQADFVISLFAGTVTQLLGIVFLWVVYQKIPNIQGWEFWEVAFVYAAVFFIEGVQSLFLNGMWVLGGLVNKGEMDRILVRPISPILQVFTSNIGIGGMGSIIVGGVIMVQSLQHIHLDWTLSKVLISLLFLASAVVIRVSILFAANCQTFWTGSSNTSFAHTIHTLGQLAQYPISIYNIGVQLLITIIVPFAFISFFPASYLFGKGSWAYWGMLTPLVAVYTVILAGWIFKKGLSKYESAGN